MDRDYNEKEELFIYGVVSWSDKRPINDVKIFIYADDELLHEVTSDEKGSFEYRGKFKPIDNLYVLVYDAKKDLLLSTKESKLHIVNPKIELNLIVNLLEINARNNKPTIKVGPFHLDAEQLRTAKPQLVLDLANLLVNKDINDEAVKRVESLCPELVPSVYSNRTLCGTAILQTIDEIIKIRKFPREVGLDVDKILSDYGGYTSAIYHCGNFIINYYLDGPAAISLDTSTQDVVDPGTGTVLTTLTSDGATPTYLKRICFWLNRALTRYISPPFNLRNPAAGGAIPVVINTAPFGSATPSTFYLNNVLPADLIAAVTVHELFHMVQFQYSITGSDWFESMIEGGAVWAEDTNTEMLNRYIDEAKSNFNGVGVQIQPEQSLESAVYKCSLFWRYLSEQESTLVMDGDPLPLDLNNVGVDVYKPLIEACSAGSWSTNDLKNAINTLPWYRNFYEFGYLDGSNQDLSNAETIYGNYVVACFVKDLGASVPDRRFTFMENDETVYIDEVLGSIGIGGETVAPGDTLIPVAMASTGTLHIGSSVSFNGSLFGTFSSQYYSATIDPAVTSVNIHFTSTFANPLFHVVLIDEDNNIRELYRSNSNNYIKQCPNLLHGKRLQKIVVIISATTTFGNYGVTLNSVSAAPDVMITRWNSVVKKEYEYDPYNWSWTWVSPDVWVDNNADGMADSEVYFNYDNQLFIRLHNKGNADANNISVALYYQDGSAGLTSAGWLPVQDTHGVTQSLNALSLAAGTDNQWSVNWSPVSSGASHHFCVRAIVTAPGDPNTDNKKVMSNFGNVIVRSHYFADVTLIRRNVDDAPREVMLTVIPRLKGGLTVSQRDIVENKIKLLNPKEEYVDTIRITHKPIKSSDTEQKDKSCNCDCNGNCAPTSIPSSQPNLHGHYATVKGSLPPGVENHSLVTIVNTVDGKVLGGFTFMVKVKE